MATLFRQSAMRTYRSHPGRELVRATAAQTATGPRSAPRRESCAKRGKASGYRGRPEAARCWPGSESTCAVIMEAVGIAAGWICSACC